MRETSRPIDRIGGEEGNVGVDLGRDRMVIAGADMTIGGERAGFAAHDHGQFGVRLQFDEAKHDLRTGAFEIARPADVGGLVETRLEFDEGGHRLAGFRRLDEGAHDRTVGGGAIKRLLDRDDIGIGRRLVEELHHDIEGFIRVVDDEILLFDRKKTIAAIVADALGKARIIGLELEVRPVETDELGKLVQGEHPVEDRKFPRRRHRVPRPRNAAQLLGHETVEFDPDHRTAAAALQRAFEQEHQILGLFLDLEIAVADDPEEPMTAHLIAGKQALREHADHGFERDEALALLAELVGEADESLDLGWQADQGFPVLLVARPEQFEGDRKAEIGNERERMRGINGKRRENRKNMRQKMLMQPFRFSLVEIRRIDDRDSGFAAAPCAIRASAAAVPPPKGSRARGAWRAVRAAKARLRMAS